ncbi:TIM barrel protein [Maribacter sp. MAR_2009_72]|uniref:TIM barrel protein n=1 Tax=Maribacter sp. MAR_2009_72 TaxID=1250050 RepID=UPI00119A7FF8|nr:TIM barrel protein [Maribacter sp. MAR_2009_72]TVZ14904.1 sugar phosphate isomerase/epimerase [Maribacter sp. MAR_2009_72]
MKNIWCIIFLTFSLLGQAQGIDESLYAFDFKMDGMSVPERSKLFAELGYKGVTFAVKNDGQRKKLQEYLDSPEFLSGKLSIPVVYFPFDFSQDYASEGELWKKTLNALPKNASLWVIILEPNATDQKVITLLKEMTSEAEKLGKDIVLYPHDNTFIEAAEESLTYIEALNTNNLYTTLHLCHEMRAGNGNRLLDVAIKTAPYVKFASISGTDVTMRENEKADWSDAIQPLDKGDFEVEKFVSVLQKIGFKGKTVLHTFGIEEEPTDHLSLSMQKWKDMIVATYTNFNNNLDQILDTPENAYWDSGSKTWFISNLGGEKVTIEKDGYGWITRLDENGNVLKNRWVEGLDAPTGMSSQDGHLYAADRGVLVKIRIEDGKIVKKIPLPGSRFANDVAATPDGNIYVSDTYENIIYRIDNKGNVEIFLQNEELECPNGLWVDGDDLIVATWGPMTNEATFDTSRKGTLKKVNLKTKEILAVGKGLPIANFDGVVKYKGFYYATDWVGGRLLKISNNGNVSEVLTGFVQMADLGIDPERGILLIPEMSKNRFIKVALESL